MLFHTTSARIDRILQRDGFILLDFYAPWCAPCRELAPQLEALTDELDLTAFTVNTDTDRSLAERFGVDALPTVMLLRDGVILQQWIRPDCDDLTAQLHVLIKK